MDINAIKEAVEKLTKDESAKEAFRQDPVKSVESILGVDLPDEMVEKIINTAKAKLEGSDIVDEIKDEAEKLIEGGIKDGIMNKVKDLLK